MTRILAVIGSPSARGRTAAAAEAVLTAVRDSGAETDLIELADTTVEDAVAAMDQADAVLFGSPVYRAGHSALLRELLEHTQRGFYGETSAPLRGKAAAIVMTGASGHHYLASDALRAVLSGFFAVQVLSPSLYLDGSAYTPDKILTDAAQSLAASHGHALVELSSAVRSSKALSRLEPQV